ncbi:pentatricopeptide repeat-containing protein [Panicum miliaceum]|uniref:Pentatricopeptide repeat-containing protein n=1 Tax=Panicum miliaceum TaxID=4540 RepID=A0A3L6SML6_PANMI|nr:pentatricopeptide repeat-containing protein [Panicum miliaceum]
MASPAVYSRARRLFSVFSSTPPRAQVPKFAPVRAPTPAPGLNAADGEADAKPHAGRNRRMSIGKILRVISEERHPDKLVSQFITASTASPSFRDNRRVYEVAVSRLASYGHSDAVAALLDSQKPFIEEPGLSAALDVIPLMEKCGLTPDEITFNTLLNGFYNNCRFNDAEKVWEMMKERNVEPNTKSYNAKLRGLVTDGRIEDAVAVIEVMQKDGPKPDSVSYNELIRGALCQKPDLSAALDVIALMDKCGLTPDEISFNTLLNGFYNNGCCDDAEKVWEMMKERNVKPGTKSYNAKLRGLVSRGSIEDAIGLIERMQEDGPKPDTVSYNELIRGYCNEGRLDEAKKLYDDLVKNECAPNRGTFQTLVPRVLEAGELDSALRCCHEILNRKCKVQCSLLQGVVTALVAASRVEEAKTIVELGRKNFYPRKGLRMPPRTREDMGLKMPTY